MAEGVVTGHQHLPRNIDALLWDITPAPACRF
jgi:hypothetical protein